MRGETRVGPGTSGGPGGGWSTMVGAGKANGSNSGGLEVRNPANFRWFLSSVLVGNFQANSRIILSILSLIFWGFPIGRMGLSLGLDL